VSLRPGDLVGILAPLRAAGVTNYVAPPNKWVGVMLRASSALVIAVQPSHARNTLVLTSDGLFGWVWGEDMRRLT
jgi:hypothetical protein